MKANNLLAFMHKPSPIDRHLASQSSWPVNPYTVRKNNCSIRMKNIDTLNCWEYIPNYKIGIFFPSIEIKALPYKEE